MYTYMYKYLWLTQIFRILLEIRLKNEFMQVGNEVTVKSQQMWVQTITSEYEYSKEGVVGAFIAYKTLIAPITHTL